MTIAPDFGVDDGLYGNNPSPLAQAHPSERQGGSKIPSMRNTLGVR